MRVLPVHEKDLGGGFVVRRSLPAMGQGAPERRAIGPFVFFDHFGPTVVEADANVDVRPHPHIGLATITWLFEGALLHRDSLGYVQRIEPGAVNWMVAGRGIVHSERRPEDLRGRAYRSHGLQLWVALPREAEEVAPSFHHVAEVPRWSTAGGVFQLLVGALDGRVSPVPTFSPTLYVDVHLDGAWEAPAEVQQAGAPGAPSGGELGIYVLDGDVRLAGEPLPPGRLVVLEEARRLEGRGHLVAIGGAPLDGPRHIHWNFVSSRADRIAEAVAAWDEDRMGQIPGETERIPGRPWAPTSS